MLVQLNIFLIRFLEFTEDKLQLHLSQNELFGVCSVVHKGVHFTITFNFSEDQIICMRFQYANVGNYVTYMLTRSTDCIENKAI